MLGVKELHGWTLHALDGEVGSVVEVLFDDAHWTIRYVVVETGTWLSHRKVLISPIAFGSRDLDKHAINVSLTCEQIKGSPDVDTDKPISRQWEEEYLGYNAWPFYWGGMSMWGSAWYPGALLAQHAGDAESLRYDMRMRERERERSDSHLRSTKEVTGYTVFATNGHLGHIEDFIVDDLTWQIRYLSVDTQDWWPGKKVLALPAWISHLSWSEKTVTLDVTRDQVRNAPEWNPGMPISRAFEEQLEAHYSSSETRDGDRKTERVLQVR